MGAWAPESASLTAPTVVCLAAHLREWRPGYRVSRVCLCNCSTQSPPSSGSRGGAGDCWKLGDGANGWGRGWGSGLRKVGSELGAGSPDCASIFAPHRVCPAADPAVSLGFRVWRLHYPGSRLSRFQGTGSAGDPCLPRSGATPGSAPWRVWTAGDRGLAHEQNQTVEPLVSPPIDSAVPGSTSVGFVQQ